MKQLMATVLALLTIQAFSFDKNGKVELSEEHRAKMLKFLGKEFSEKFISALENDPEGKATDESVTSHLMEAINKQVMEQVASHTKMETELKTVQKNLAEEKTKRDAELAAIQKTLSEETAKKEAAELLASENGEKIKKLSQQGEGEPNPVKNPMKPGEKWKPTGNDTHLFGVNQPFMAIDDRHQYNQRAYASLMAREGIMIPAPMATTSFDYSSLKSDLGDFFRVRKQDRIQSFIAELPSLTAVFPMESNLQDEAILVNLFLDEFTQAGNRGSDYDNVTKGGYGFDSEKIKMYPVMFATKFKQLDELERTWIGYLNREGSDSMKWSFLEFIMVETAKQVKNEQEIRWIRGVRKDPTVNVAGSSIQASNGLLKFIKTKIANFQIKPFSIGEYTAFNIATYVKNATRMIPAVWRDSNKLVLYMSTDAYLDYLSNLETLYGANTDYTAGIKYVKEYPSVKIVCLPNMSPSKRMIWTIEGNILLAEDKPGEMLNFNFEQQDWTLKVWSNWKESVWAYRVGKTFASAAAMPDDYSTQLIWCNDVDEPADFYLAMDVNDTSPSVLNHTSLITVANTQATAITGIDDAVVGQEIRIRWGNATNAPTIAKSGVFSLISSAIAAPAVGDILYLKKRSDGKFIELKRESVSTVATAFTADDVTPSVAGATSFITVENQGATALTNLTNAVPGTVYTIYGGSNTHSVTIADGGNFSLTAAMTLSLGTFIKLQLSESTLKLSEIERG